MAPRSQITGLADLERPPEVLAAGAREIFKDLGYADPPRDSLFDFSPNYRFINHIGTSDQAPDRWERLRGSRPSALHFRYRQSPQPIAKVAGASIGEWMEDPPLVVPGEAMVVLDLEGRLLSFLVVPPDRIDEIRGSAVQGRLGPDA